jgi:hypothetical protein
MLVHAALSFVPKQLNLFPVKGGLSSKLSPKQIMSGKVVHYKFCAMGFGWYCQIHEEDQPHNGMVQQTQGAILLGPSGNAQGGHKFFTLTTGKVVICRAWTELPTSVAVIERVALLAKGMPALPIFTDHAGRVIGDVKDVYLHNIEYEADKALVDNNVLPGVHTAEDGLYSWTILVYSVDYATITLQLCEQKKRLMFYYRNIIYVGIVRFDVYPTNSPSNKQHHHGEPFAAMAAWLKRIGSSHPWGPLWKGSSEVMVKGF